MKSGKGKVVLVIEAIRGIQEWLRYEGLVWFFDSWVWKVFFYTLLAGEGVAYLPQWWKIHTAPRDSLEAISTTTLLMNIAIGVLILLASVYYVDPYMFLSAVWMSLVYTTAYAGYRVRTR